MASIINPNLFITGTVPALGGVINMGVYPTDFRLPNNQSFQICIETVGIINTLLEDGTVFQITTLQAFAYLGRWYPAKFLQVTKVGTVGRFSFGY
jgi:hypothetical protein